MKNNRDECWKRFCDEWYFQEFNKFNSSIAKNVCENIDKYMGEMKKLVKGFMTSINNYQYEIMQPVGCIELSFLRLSVYEDNLLFVMEAFDEKQDIGKCLASSKVEINWFKEEWTTLRDTLLLKRQDIEWKTFIREEDIYVMLQDTLTILFQELVILFKYTFEVCDMWDEYKKMNRSQMFFYISMGEYHDKQDLLFVDRQEFDIFMQDENASCKYGRFLDKVYHKKRISEKNFYRSLFENCRFEKTIFEDCDMKDNRFINCIFYGCELRDVDFSGGIFVDCVFDECDLAGVDWSNDKKCRKTLISKSRFIRSNLIQKNINECEVIYSEFIEGERSN